MVTSQETNGTSSTPGGLSGGKYRVALLVCAGWVVFVCVATILMPGEHRHWIFRNPVFYLPFRFALVFVLSLPLGLLMRDISVPLPSNPERRHVRLLKVLGTAAVLGVFMAVSCRDLGDVLVWGGVFLLSLAFALPVAHSARLRFERWRGLEEGQSPQGEVVLLLSQVGLMCITILLCPFALWGQTEFGFGQSIRYGHWLAAVPLVAGIAAGIVSVKNSMAERTRWQGAVLRAGGALWLACFVCMMSLPFMYLPYAGWDWQGHQYREFLSEKYSVEISERPYPALSEPVVHDKSTPPGLAIAYLFFGERAVDLSAFNG